MTVKSYYHYDPSTPTAVVTAVLYGISFLLSIWQTIRAKAWVWIFMVLAVGMEFVGFLFRISSTNDVTNRGAYIVQFLLIILAPVLAAASIYTAFARVVFHVVPPHARSFRLLWISPRFVTPIFVGFDIFALLLQAAGATLVSATDVSSPDAADKLTRGKDLAMAGIAVQLAAFGLFTIIAARFQFTAMRFGPDVEKKLQMESGEKKATLAGYPNKSIKPNWRIILYAINISCGLILLRSIFRMIEFSQGPTGEVSSKEWYMYVFDVIPIFSVCVIFNIAPPGAYLPFMGFRLPAAERRLPSDRAETQTMELQSEAYRPLYSGGEGLSGQH